MVLGDFNNVLSTEEKSGGLQVRNYDIIDLLDCVASVDLIDLKHVGCFFTWMSPKVCCKFDRVMVNNAWIGSNVVGFAEFIAPGSISDHSLSLVSCCVEEKVWIKSLSNFSIRGLLMITFWIRKVEV